MLAYIPAPWILWVPLYLTIICSNRGQSLVDTSEIWVSISANVSCFSNHPGWMGFGPVEIERGALLVLFYIVLAHPFMI